VKRCNRFATELPLSGFNRDSSRPNGRQRNCRSCARQLAREAEAKREPRERRNYCKARRRAA
jgi:hypothetical protein